MANNISSNGLKISIVAIPFIPKPLEIANVSPDSDIWQVANIETADAQTTPDGQSVFWGKQARIEATLTLSGASEEANVLANMIQLQMKYGHIPPVVSNVTIIVENEITGERDTFIDGVMKSGSPAQGYGSEKKTDREFVFSFAKRI